MVPHWQTLVDFLVLATAIYLLLRWGKEARALRVVVGVLMLGVASLLARQLGLLVTSWVLDAATIVAIVALLVVFQSELRQALARLTIVSRLWPRRAGIGAPELGALSNAAFSLATAHRGALIVVVRHDSVADLVSGGIPLGGEVSTEILEAIFRKVSPVHDGAAIIEGTRIARVAAILPLTERPNVPPGYGTRHRAALGLAERCDALVVVVSEERGEVTLIYDGEIIPLPGADDLFQRLTRLLRYPQGPRESRHGFWRMPAAHLRLKGAALGLAALVWVVPLFVSEGAVRTVTVPVEFRNVPAGMEIAEQSAIAIQVQLRATPWLLDTLSFTALVARFDLDGSREGSHAVLVERGALRLPPGVAVERVSPQRLSVRLVRRPNSAPPSTPRN